MQLPSSPTAVRFSLDVAQLVMLGGLIWATSGGLAKLRAAVDTLTQGLATAAGGLHDVAVGLAELVSRVAVLEDRGKRSRRHDDD